MLERWADPNVLVKLGVKRLSAFIAKTSKGHHGAERAAQWITAAETSLELYDGHPAVAFADLAAEIATEVRLLRAVQTELAAHATERESCYRWVDPAGLARSLPGVADVGGPALVAAIGDPARFARGKQFRSFTGLVPKASETGDTDRKGQAMSKAGSSLLRTTLVRAADNARKLDPQLARTYYLQMVERGKDHLGALCVVAANLAERFWAVMNRGMPYVICDTDGRRHPRRGQSDHRRALHRPTRRPRPSTQQEDGEGPPTSPHRQSSHTLEASHTRRPSPPHLHHTSHSTKRTADNQFSIGQLKALSRSFQLIRLSRKAST